MIIDIDYHGVVADTVAQKQRYAFEMFGVELQPTQCKRETIINSGLLSENDYRQLARQLYFTDKALESPSVEGSVEALLSLSEEHSVHIVTASKEIQIPLIKQWLAERELGHIALINVGYNGNKDVHDYDVFVDDKLTVLQALRNNNSVKLLLDRPYNMPRTACVIANAGSFACFSASVASVRPPG